MSVKSDKGLRFFRIMQFSCIVMFGLAITMTICTSAYAITFSWSGTINGEDPLFTATGDAEFTISGDALTIVLTNTTDDDFDAWGQLLSGLTFDLEGFEGDLEADTAVLTFGSTLEGSNTPDLSTNLSGEWGFIIDDSGVITEAGMTLEEYTISSVGLGDIFGWDDRFGDPNLWGPESMNGISGSIVNDYSGTPIDNSGNHGPLVDDSMTFTFLFDSSVYDLDESMIMNVQPLFGTDGAGQVPEPTTVLLLGSGLVGLALYGRKRSRKEAGKAS